MKHLREGFKATGADIVPLVVELTDQIIDDYGLRDGLERLAADLTAQLAKTAAKSGRAGSRAYLAGVALTSLDIKVLRGEREVTP